MLKQSLGPVARRCLEVLAVAHKLLVGCISLFLSLSFSLSFSLTVSPSLFFSAACPVCRKTATATSANTLVEFMEKQDTLLPPIVLQGPVTA